MENGVERVLCGGCKFWKGSEGGSVGECRREPPKALYESARAEVTCYWPEVSDKDWCGAGQMAHSV